MYAQVLSLAIGFVSPYAPFPPVELLVRLAKEQETARLREIARLRKELKQLHDTLPDPNDRMIKERERRLDELLKAR